MRARIIALLLVPAVTCAQEGPAQLTAPASLTRSDEIRFAKTAAPAEISNGARVYVLEGGRYVVAEPGSTGVACLVTRTFVGSFDPQCGDSEADATVFAVERFRTEQRIAGRSLAEIRAEVDKGLASGRFRAPKRPALVYMQSASQILTDSTGGSRTRFMPHIMVYYPMLKGSTMGIVASNSADIPGMVEEGTPMSALVIVTRDWVDPAAKQ